MVIIALLSPNLAPLAFAFSSAIMKEGNHYCEVSKGPCKHGDACPIKHGHPKKLHEKHEMGHEHHSEKNEKKTSRIASACHTSEDSPRLPPPHRDDPFIKTEICITEEENIQKSLKVLHLYKNPFSTIPYKPPAA